MIYALTNTISDIPQKSLGHHFENCSLMPTHLNGSVHGFYIYIYIHHIQQLQGREWKHWIFESLTLYSPN